MDPPREHRTSARLACGILLLLAADLRAPRSAPGAGPPGLAWHVENVSGKVLESHDGDRTVNPASVVKIATSLWALERLGPGHRFETRFAASARLDPETGRLDGDLIVLGAGDPDFHPENAMLVAEALNRIGLREVGGALRVGEGFWLGWEGGSEGRVEDPSRRARQMGLRLRNALDPRRWDERLRETWRQLALRRGTAGASAPRVAVRGGVAPIDGAGDARVLLVHRSNPLAVTLKRFNAYSNNDIERFSYSLGSAAELTRELSGRWSIPPARLRFETLSGLGSNRLSPRAVVRLLRELRRTGEGLELTVTALLPVAGCDPGTLRQFPRLTEGAAARSLVGKTGTLVRTDGGVAVLAGFLDTAEGELAFCVVAPDSGSRVAAARRAQEDWLLALADRHGGARARDCPPPPGHSDDDAIVVTPSGEHGDLGQQPSADARE